MTQFQKISLLLLRLSLGWLFFYAGITKILDPSWTSAGYIKGAKLFPQFIAQPNQVVPRMLQISFCRFFPYDIRKRMINKTF